MFDTPTELAAKIALGEDTSLELKAVTFRGDGVDGPRRKELADELAAMANTTDGVLVLGVEDRSREVTGIPVEKLDLVERYVFEICSDSVEPPVVFRTQRLELPDPNGVPRPVPKLDDAELLLTIWAAAPPAA